MTNENDTIETIVNNEDDMTDTIVNNEDDMTILHLFIYYRIDSK